MIIRLLAQDVDLGILIGDSGLLVVEARHPASERR